MTLPASATHGARPDRSPQPDVYCLLLSHYFTITSIADFLQQAREQKFSLSIPVQTDNRVTHRVTDVRDHGTEVEQVVNREQGVDIR